MNNDKTPSLSEQVAELERLIAALVKNNGDQRSTIQSLHAEIDRLKAAAPQPLGLWVRDGEPDEEIRWAKWALLCSGTIAQVLFADGTPCVYAYTNGRSFVGVWLPDEPGWNAWELPDITATADTREELEAHLASPETGKEPAPLPEPVFGLRMEIKRTGLWMPCLLWRANKDGPAWKFTLPDGAWGVAPYTTEHFRVPKNA